MSFPVLKASDYPSDASLYIFDFCGTLFDSNTSLDYLAWLGAKGALSSWRLMTSRSWAGIGRRCGLFDPAEHMQVRTKVLEGQDAKRIQEHADEFCNVYLHSRRRASETAFFHWCLDEGKEVVLLSYTYEFLLEGFVRSLMGHTPHHVLGSTLEVLENGRLSGRYARQMHRVGKYNRLCEVYDPGVISRACFLTDDIQADGDVLTKVAYPLIGEHR
jgi:phosphoserine phosphatase